MSHNIVQFLPLTLPGCRTSLPSNIRAAFAKHVESHVHNWHHICEMICTHHILRLIYLTALAIISFASLDEKENNNESLESLHLCCISMVFSFLASTINSMWPISQQEKYLHFTQYFQYFFAFLTVHLICFSIYLFPFPTGITQVMFIMRYFTVFAYSFISMRAFTFE